MGVSVTNSKEMPSWFKSITAAAKSDPLDYVLLAEDISHHPMTAETVHYIHVLLQHMEDERAFRRSALTQNEINARIILNGYLQQVEEIHGKLCIICRGTGVRPPLYGIERSRFYRDEVRPPCRACDGKGRIKCPN